MLTALSRFQCGLCRDMNSCCMPLKCEAGTLPKKHDHFLFPIRLNVIFHQFFLYSPMHAWYPLSFCFQLFPASFTSFKLKTTPSSPCTFSLPSASFLPSLTLCSIAAVMYRLLGLHFFSSYSTSPQRVSNTNVRESVGASVGGERAGDQLWPRWRVAVKPECEGKTAESDKPKKAACLGVWAVLLHKDEMFLFAVQSGLLYMIGLRCWCMVQVI